MKKIIQSCLVCLGLYSIVQFILYILIYNTSVNRIIYDIIGLILSISIGLVVAQIRYKIVNVNKNTMYDSLKLFLKRYAIIIIVMLVIHYLYCASGVSGNIFKVLLNQDLEFSFIDQYIIYAFVLDINIINIGMMYISYNFVKCRYVFENKEVEQLHV